MDMQPGYSSTAPNSESPLESAQDSRSSRLGLECLALAGASPAALKQLTDRLLASVDPDDSIERMLTEMVVLAAFRLRNATLAESQAEATLPGLDWCRYQGLADRGFRAALKDLARHQARKARPAPQPSSPSKSASTARSTSSKSDAQESPSNAPPPPPESTPEEIAEAFTNWRRHIALVPSKSDEWPIILRVGREVEDVAAWLADGKTEDELLTWYPELSRADIAACRGCDADGLCGPFDPADGPYPPGLPVLDDLPDEFKSS